MADERGDDIVATTDRLVLREWRPADRDDFYAVMNTPGVMRYLGGVQTPDQWHAAHDRLMGFTRDYGHTFWIVEDRASGELLGFCGLKRVNAPGAGELTGTPEIGWRLRESAWGRGIASEAAVAAMELAFGRFGYDAVVAMTVPDNIASQKVMAKLGMTRAPELDFEDSRFGPELNPAWLWRIDRAGWQGRR